ncbi:DHA1 family L-arabinose/isopropyl-beta-D-thiogalactopyranoside export protein-like MFS transporter/DHA1 family inner membrane transport protein [Isoptericola jiangsuensis]|uniref:DHA1 family L-arabinose/isopropyl-beta-D-thiogalactopyranoside export protein-like MFS transporter/DHA1 family inner membrane transport protein n=1 Tax=Isoptericola jiangsuensis TaxID=548579 RepID=A0A2A9F1Y1_9MICO|nr:MFS transporter [Isoptericola jiangsuensis]PFG44781.1 DHA1 family L-arabinose/isopropyl-beta-D-thiogalactopyranoside export protein-like MFS transporter/DHA1 family inner membrane transport protein [Isoptericola jiangsuensis]
MTTQQPTFDPRRASIILAAMATSTFLFVTVESLPSGLLTLMAPDLGRSTSEIGLLVTAYALVVLVSSVPLAWATSRIPRRWVLSACCGVAAVATLWAALTPSYEQLMAARLVTGLAQALFWVAVVPATLGLFPPLVRGRAMSRLAVGNSLAPLLGVPLGTWLGEQTSWRVTFAAVAALSAVVMVIVLVLFPTVAPRAGGAAQAPHPSGRRFGFQLVTTVLVVTGAFGVITFGTQYLQDVTGFTQSDIPALLLVQGGAGVVGALVVGRYLDRYPAAALVVAVTTYAVGVLGLWALGENKVAAVAFLVVCGLSFSTVPPALSHRVMLVAPRGTTMAQAVASSTFNLGIAAGSALGALLVAVVDVRVVPLVAAVLVLLALAVLLLEERLNAPLGTVVEHVEEAVARES